MTGAQAAIGRLHGAYSARRHANVAALVLGFGLGQGSLFLAQIWLAREGALARLAEFGIHFSFAILAMLLIEAGSVVTLARRVALDPQEIWRPYWANVALRLTLAAGVALVFIGYALTTPDAFARGYCLAAAPGLLLSAVSPAGLLDGLKRSGVSGLAAGLPHVFSAVAIFPTLDSGSFAAGAVLGTALTSSFLAAVLFQFFGLHAMGYRPAFRRPTGRDIRAAWGEGVAMLCVSMPGQIYFRLQILLCTASLGAETAGLFIIAKQVVSALSQLLVWARRAEFPQLVRTVHRERSFGFARLFAFERARIALALLIVVFVAATSLVVSAVSDGGIVAAAKATLFLSLYPLSIGVYASLTQLLFAQGRFQAAAFVFCSSAISGLLVCGVLVDHLGLLAFALGDLSDHLVGALFAALLLRAGMRRAVR